VGPFELVVSTQSVADADAVSVVAEYGGDDSPHHDPSGLDDGPRARTLRMIAGALGPQGTYLAIEPLPTPDAMRAFVSEAAASGLVLSFLGFTPFDPFGQPRGYPVAVFRRRSDVEADAVAAGTTLPEIDIEGAYLQAVIDHLPHLLRGHADGADGCSAKKVCVRTRNNHDSAACVEFCIQERLVARTVGLAPMLRDKSRLATPNTR